MGGMDAWGPWPPSGAKAPRSAPYSSPGGLPDEGRGVYVGGLNFSTQWQKLKDHMRQAGNVEYVDVLMNEMGQPKGVGYVRYATEAEAQQAVSQMNGSILDEKQLAVDPWTGPKPRNQ